MRKAEFKVPVSVMPEFTKELIRQELEHQLIGTTKKNKIIVEVHYSRDETETVNELEEYLEQLIEDSEYDGDEEDDDDNG